jgi:deoxyribonuclease V
MSSVREARELLLSLAAEVRLRPLGRRPRLVAGLDAAYASGHTFAAACLFTFPELEPVEEAVVREPTRFPYVPGYLSLREGPALAAAVLRLRRPPDLLIVEGQGVAHPDRAGLAAIVGVRLGLPAVGCAKSRLVGEYVPPGLEKGSWSSLVFRDEIVGAVLRTKSGCRPLFVSPGHLVSLEDCVEAVMGCVRLYRQPEPLRAAHRCSGASAAGFEQGW